MSDTEPTLKDIWRLLGTMNKRFDALERQGVALTAAQAELRAEMAELRHELTGQMQRGFGALRGMIEARDFRLDEHGRRITELEQSRS